MSSAMKELERLYRELSERLERVELRSPQAVGGTGAGAGGAEHKSSHEEGQGDAIDGDALEFDTPTTPVGFDSTDITAENSLPDEDGVIHAWFIVEIPRVEAAADYILSYRKTGTTEFTHILVEQPASGNPEIKTYFVECNIVYYFKICARGKTGVCSSWTSEVSKTSLKDTAAPSTPTGLAATGMFNGILVDWDKVSASDLSYYELYHNTVNNFGTATLIAESKVTAYFWKTNVSYVVQYFWIKAVDKSGNKSSETSSANATPVKLASGDIAANAVVNAAIASGAVSEVKLGDGAVVAAKIGIGAVEAAKIGVNAVVADKIAAGAVVADKIGAGAVIATKLAADSVIAEKIAANAITAIKINALAITAAKIDVGAVTATKIATDAVTTQKIKFDVLTSDPSQYIRTLWYRSDLDKLIFGGETGEKGYIPRYPLTLADAPAENLLSNGGFEDDIDGNSIPDWWELVGSVPPTWVTTDPQKGGHHLRLSIVGGSGQNAAAYNEKFLVRGNKKYFASVRHKYVAGSADTLVYAIHWYQKNKTTHISTMVFGLGTDSSWVTKSLEVTSPPLARYVQIEIYLWQPTVTTTAYVDDVIFSEQKAVISTAEIVAASGTLEGSPVAVAQNTWTTILSFTVPSENHEILFSHIKIVRSTYNAELSAAVRLKRGSNYYPSSVLAKCPRTECWPHASVSSRDHVLITIPKNLAGETIDVQIYTSHADNYYATYISWGHSPHRHQ